MESNQTAEFFDSYATGFNALYGNDNNLFNRIINRFFRKSMKLRFEKTIAGCSPIENKTVLDIGCGPGHYGINLALLGAAKITGIDFAANMIKIAEKNAARAKVADKCEFIVTGFDKFNPADGFDYTILIGFMDYIENQPEIIEKALSLTKSRAFFSFPANDGILAWQRKIRYKKRCPLYMYNHQQIKKLFESWDNFDIKIDRVDRDYLVTASLKK